MIRNRYKNDGHGNDGLNGYSTGENRAGKEADISGKRLSSAGKAS
jgi:hypothetical protein